MSTLPLDASVSPKVTDGERTSSLQQQLADRLVVLHRRVGEPPSLERRIALIGGTLVAAGAVLELLAWYGASNTSRVYLQIPYLISGGLLGIVLAVAGGCAYLASWLTRLVQDQQASVQEAVAATRATTAALARIEALLGGTATTAQGASLATDDPTGWLATPSGRLAHRPTCAVVAGRSDLRPVSVGPDGLARCRMCEDS